MYTRNRPLFGIAVVIVAIILFGFGARVDAAASPPGLIRQANRLLVSQTAQTAFTRTYQWTLSFSAAPNEWNLMDSDEAVSRLTVHLTKMGQKDSDWVLLGTIHIENPTQSSATVLNVVDTLFTNNQPVKVGCPQTMPFQLGAGQTVDCTYQVKFSGPKRGTSRVRVQTSGRVTGTINAIDFAFGQPTSELNAAVQVGANGEIYGPFEENASFSYEKTFNCRQPGAQEESAVIMETGQTSRASVQVNCFGFQYAKSSQTYRTGQGWGLKGSLELQNAGAADIWVANVRELVSPDLEAQVNCGYDFASGAYRLAPGKTLTCTFQMALPDQSERWNYSRITLQNSHYDADGNRTVMGTTDFLTDPTPFGFSE